METLVKILSMNVITESNLPKQEKLELLDFVKDNKDMHVLQEVLESYGLIENCGECGEDEDEDEDEEGLSLEDLDEWYPGCKGEEDEDEEEEAASESVVQEIPFVLKNVKMKIPSSTQHMGPSLRAKSPGGLVKVKTLRAPAFP